MKKGFGTLGFFGLYKVTIFYHLIAKHAYPSYNLTLVHKSGRFLDVVKLRFVEYHVHHIS